jgi:hypothetical protein
MRSSKLFGVISMVQRSRRRYLVIGVYVFLAALMSLVIFRKGGTLFRSGDSLGPVNLIFVILFTGIARGIFGSLVRQATFPEPEPDQNLSLRQPYPSSDSDEREVAVRNWAYYAAFRFVAIYLVLLWIAFAVLIDAKTPWLSVNTCGLLLFPVVTAAITLPQALILWTEPDLPEPDTAESLLSAASR